MVPVSGQVVYKSRNLEYGSVMLQPIGGGELARGKIEPNGTFVLTTLKSGDGAIVGKHRVRITAFDAQKSGMSAASSDREPSLGKSAIPAHFNSFGTSGLTVEVSEDMKQPVVFDLDQAK